MHICFFPFMVATLISSLAAMVLQFTLAKPGLIVTDQKDAEADLVIGDIVFKICVVWYFAGLRSLHNAKHSCILATALFLFLSGLSFSSPTWRSTTQSLFSTAHVCLPSIHAWVSTTQSWLSTFSVSISRTQAWFSTFHFLFLHLKSGFYVSIVVL